MPNELRHACRSLGKSPTFAFTTVVCLALGIGANTAVFSLLDAALLRSLPVPDPERLVTVEAVPAGPAGSTHSYPGFRHLRDHAAAVADVFAYARADLQLSGPGITDGPAALMVSDNYFAALQVQPVLGRAFVSAEEPVVVISHRYWRARFQGDPSVVGRGLVVNGLPFTVAGVLPPGFFGTEAGRSPDVFVPLALRDSLSQSGPRLSQPNSFWLRVMARLAPGIARQQAAARLQDAHQRYVDGVGGTVAPGLRRLLERRRVSLAPGARGGFGVGEQFGAPLRILMATAAAVLLIACVNVAGLMLTRAIARRREIAIRLALGATRRRLMRHLLAESAVLSTAGGIAGLFIGIWSARALAAVLSDRVLVLPFNGRMLAFTAATSALAALVFGAAPAMRASGGDLTPGLKDTVSRATRAPFVGRLLLPAQVALTLVLLTGAGLFARSLINLRTLDAGFEGDRVVLATVNPALSRYPAERIRAFQAELLERAAAMSGIESVALADAPLLDGMFVDGMSIEGLREPVEVSLKLVSPRFFETMGIRLLAGRDFAATDSGDAPRVAVINETIARRYFGGRSPIGAHIDVLGAPRTEIVGVIADTKYGDLRAAIPNTVYVPLSQAPAVGTERTLHVRTQSDPSAAVPALRDLIRAIDSTLAVRIRPFAAVVDANLERERLIASLSTVFAALALILTATGLFGLIAHSVERRTREIAIRVSLGARSGRVVWMVLRDCVIVAAAGIAVGIPVARWTSAAVSAQLFGVSPSDPATTAGAAAALVLVALIAGYVPARRASRVDPMVALRQE